MNLPRFIKWWPFFLICEFAVDLKEVKTERISLNFDGIFAWAEEEYGRDFANEDFRKTSENGSVEFFLFILKTKCELRVVTLVILVI